MNISQPLRQIQPSKGLGQNFLIDKAAIKRIIEAADIKPDEVVLEIGPGTGALTLELAKRAKKVIAVEKDQKMVDILLELLAGQNVRNVEVIKGDILKIQKSKTEFPFMETKVKKRTKFSSPIKNQNYKVVANLPFYLTAPVIRQLLENTGVQPRQMVLLVQKEVGQRICVRPPDMNLLAVSVQFYAKPKIIGYISKKSFWPQPKVDSAILKISQICPDKKIDSHRFFNIVKSGFSHPRKQLINNLSTGLSLSREQVKTWLLKNKILPTRRAETLSLDDWIKLTKSL